MFDPTSNVKMTPKADGYRRSTTGGQHKDFQKVMGKDSDEERGSQQEREKVKDGKDAKGTSFDVVAENSKKKSNVSLFELAKTESDALQPIAAQGALVEEEELPIKSIPDDVQQESLSALFRGYGSKEKLKSLQGSLTVPSSIGEDGKNIAMVQTLGENVDIAPALKEKSKGNESMQFTTREQPDLAGINPLAGTSFTIEANSLGTAPPTSTVRADMQEIIDQIVANLYTLRVEGKTDTLVTLKQPPLFEGANLVITTFDTAKGEFNIKFENLTQAAKHVLDLGENQNALRLALEDKGFTVHIITATTINETLNVAKSDQSQDTRRERGDGEQQRERRQREDEDTTG